MKHLINKRIELEIFSNKRNLIKLLIDVVTMLAGVIIAFGFKYEGKGLENINKNNISIYLGIFLATYLIRKNGLKSWRYTNSLDILDILKTNLITLTITTIYFIFFPSDSSKLLMLLSVALSTGIQLFFRLLFRLSRFEKALTSKKENKPRALVYGAGEAGIILLKENQTNPNYPYDVTSIIDDDDKKIGTYINNIKVEGNFYDLEEVIREKDIEVVIIAIPTINKEKIKEIIKLSKNKENIKVKILPVIDEILEDESITKQLRDVKIEDLLGRQEISINGEEIRGIIEDKIVFVTGGAGSIGSELARQIARYKPQKLVTIDVNENELYFLELELKRLYPSLNLQSEVCNIREEDKVEILFDRYKPHIVFHAAAHKHVPLMEHNPEEAIKNNIFGTKKVSEMAIKYGADRFVLISTDKAVNPTNIMGATKRGCEIIVESMNGKSTTKFMAVRFGNVLGSNGSVIPIFKKLINEGKNLTLTHPDITRYFMTIPEAAQLVLEAGSLSDGGELFILDMGEPIKIMDLAKSMIELSNSDVKIEVVGLRPGEKLYEELLYDVTKARKTKNNKIFITEIDESNINLEEHLEVLEKIIKKPQKEEIKAAMKKFITTYKEAKV